ncbi:hypothetical protein J437_LFUL009042 [Ladona fulva]|uniref:UBA domain-containing protein n=1 Tax=Ladona fulva TaxID=123851 RepID=A0A8K0K4A2_LADFU|nr:hypothetical protein J437_LFUL009042 [Ladona fulva]
MFCNYFVSYIFQELTIWNSNSSCLQALALSPRSETADGRSNRSPMMSPRGSPQLGRRAVLGVSPSAPPPPLPPRRASPTLASPGTSPSNGCSGMQLTVPKEDAPLPPVQVPLPSAVQSSVSSPTSSSHHQPSPSSSSAPSAPLSCSFTVTISTEKDNDDAAEGTSLSTEPATVDASYDTLHARDNNSVPVSLPISLPVSLPPPPPPPTPHHSPLHLHHSHPHCLPRNQKHHPPPPPHHHSCPSLHPGPPQPMHSPTPSPAVSQNRHATPKLPSTPLQSSSTSGSSGTNCLQRQHSGGTADTLGGIAEEGPSYENTKICLGSSLSPVNHSVSMASLVVDVDMQPFSVGSHPSLRVPPSTHPTFVTANSSNARVANQRGITPPKHVTMLVVDLSQRTDPGGGGGTSRGPGGSIEKDARASAHHRKAESSREEGTVDMRQLDVSTHREGESSVRPNCNGGDKVLDEDDVNSSSSIPPYENLNMEYIARLTSEGYAQEEVIRALGITRNNVGMAWDILHEFATKRTA